MRKPVTIIRRCWCKRRPDTCLVHTLGKHVENCNRGEPVFGDLSIEWVRQALRTLMHELDEPQAAIVRTHDLRRGHTDEIRALGGDDKTIRAAGGWMQKSMAPLDYLDLQQLEMEGCMLAHGAAASDSDSD